MTLCQTLLFEESRLLAADAPEGDSTWCADELDERGVDDDGAAVVASAFTPSSVCDEFAGSVVDTEAIASAPYGMDERYIEFFVHFCS